MNERYLSKTPNVTFGYLSKCNKKLPVFFWKFQKKVFVNWSSPPSQSTPLRPRLFMKKMSIFFFTIDIFIRQQIVPKGVQLQELLKLDDHGLCKTLLDECFDFSDFFAIIIVSKADILNSSSANIVICSQRRSAPRTPQTRRLRPLWDPPWTRFWEKLQVLRRTCLRNSITISGLCLWPIRTTLIIMKNEIFCGCLCFFIWIVTLWSESLDFTSFGESAIASIFAKGWDSLGFSKKMGKKMRTLVRNWIHFF